MRRADRLFQIIQILRRSRGPVTAAAIATELETSTRTVYRDIADLIGQRVPIEGEAGFGYVLDPAYDMPPLMLTPDEIEAVVLGAQWVAGLSDPVLSSAARDVIGKIATAVPEKLRPFIFDPSVAPKPSIAPRKDGIDLAQVRNAIRKGWKLRLRYASEAGVETGRTVWPVVLGYAEASRMLVAWCELRQGFRHFRTERIRTVEVIEERYPSSISALRREWQVWRETELAARSEP